MKKMLTVILSLSLLTGAATMAFGQTDTNKKKSSKKKKKGSSTDKKSS